MRLIGRVAARCFFHQLGNLAAKSLLASRRGKRLPKEETNIMMRELTDAELDVVAAGSNQGNNGTGLVVVGANIGDITVTDILSHNTVQLTDIANGNVVQVPIGVAVAVLS